MKRRTLIELPTTILLTAVAAGIVIARLRKEPESGPPPSSTATPRMNALIRDLDSSLPTASTPAPLPSAIPANPLTSSDPAENETGFIVIQVRERDGSLPSEPVVLFNDTLQFEREVPDGRLVLTTLTGELSFQVKTIQSPSPRQTESQTVTVTGNKASELNFVLPEPNPAPDWIPSGLELQVEEGYLLVVSVTEDSPARRAGFQAGDGIVSIAGTAVTSMSDTEIAAGLIGQAGDRIPVVAVVRDANGQLQEQRIELVFE